MHTSLRFLTIGLAFCGAALANETDTAATAANSDSVAKLKSSLTDSSGFKVDNVRTGGEGASCINYRVNNQQGGTTKALAVVQGDKVLRSTSRSKEFEQAWNSKCVSKDGAG